MEQDFLGRINQIKHNMQNLWEKYSDADFELAKKKLHDVTDVVKDKFQKLTDSEDELPKIQINNHKYESHYPDDDLPLTLAKDPEAGVRFYDTENSPASFGKPKAPGHGIDSFDDEDDEVFEEDIRRPATPVRRKKTPVKTKKQHLH